MSGKKAITVKLENKRKAIRSGTRVVKGPAIRFQSLTMPLIEEIKKEEVDAVAADKKAAAAALIGKKLNASLDFNTDWNMCA